MIRPTPGSIIPVMFSKDDNLVLLPLIVIAIGVGIFTAYAAAFVGSILAA